MLLSRRRALGFAAVGLAALLGTGCNLTARRLAGEWESERLPQRTLLLRRDGTYLQRFSGKTLGVISDLVGPEVGTWTVEEGTLVLVGTVGDGDRRTRHVAVDDLGRRTVRLDGEPWRRVR